MKGVTVVVAVACAAIGVARAQNRIALDEIVGSWQGDVEIQYVELRMLADGQNAVAGVAAVVFDDATGSIDNRRAYIFPYSVARGVAGAKILLATTRARDLAGVPIDYPLPTGFLRPTAGRVCFAVDSGEGFVPIDCVAYGAYKGDNLTFGPPITRTPDNRALQRVRLDGRNRGDWTSVLDPVLENSVGGTGTLPETLCGDGIISQGEVCDGQALGGATCASLGFAKGKIACVQCHYDTSECTSCGNEAINAKEECDGGDLGERTCDSLGYTGGTLACTEDCKLTMAACDPTFFVAGGGPPKTDCLGAWRVTNTTGGPNAKGKTPARQTCKDGNAGCDADGVADGTCTFTVSACFGRQDARFPKCLPAATSSWTLLGKVDPATPPVASLLGAVAALGPSTVAGVEVTFAPMLTEADACSASVAVTVAAGGKLVLRARTAGPEGKPKDTDVLRLGCMR